MRPREASNKTEFQHCGINYSNNVNIATLTYFVIEELVPEYCTTQPHEVENAL